MRPDQPCCSTNCTVERRARPGPSPASQRRPPSSPVSSRLPSELELCVSQRNKPPSTRDFLDSFRTVPRREDSHTRREYDRGRGSVAGTASRPTSLRTLHL